MRSNIKLGKIFGIEVGLNYSWFLIAALMALSLGQHFRQTNRDWSTSEIWIAAFLTAALFFVTLLLHELAHSLVAKKRGLKVTEITLFALGGVSQIEDDATDAKTEFLVAIAGPVASVFIGFGCLGMAQGLGWQHATEPTTAVSAVLVWLGYINISLAIFNMIPAFPLDGGRVLRSIIWTFSKDEPRSTRIAARVGEAIAVLFILDGIWRYFSGAGFGGLWIAFTGWFLLDAAKASYAQGKRKTTAAAIRGIRVADLMSQGCVAVDGAISLREFVDAYLLRMAQRCFAVKDHGHLAGMISRSDVAAIPSELWHTTTVRAAMHPIDDLHTVTPDTSVLDALKLMLRGNVSQLPVVANGDVEGVLFRSQLAQLLKAQKGPSSAQQAMQLSANDVARESA